MALRRGSATIRVLRPSRSRAKSPARVPDAIRAAKRMLNNLSVDPGSGAARRIRRAAETARQPQPDRSRARQHGKARAASLRRRSSVRHPEEPRKRRLGDGPRASWFETARRRAPHHERSPQPDDRSESDNDQTSQLFLGIISGQRRRDHDEVADRADRIASGLQKLGVKQGDSVAMLMRNDIAFIEAAYAAMRLGAYGVPVNWHFKPEEINYVLKDSGTRGADRACRHAASVARCDSGRRHGAERADAAGNPRQLQDRSRIISRRRISRSISNPG